MHMSLLGPLTLSTEITINKYQGMKNVLDFEKYNSNAAKCDCRRRPTRFWFPYSVEPVASGLNTLAQAHLISSAKCLLLQVQLILITSKQYQSDERPRKKPRHHGNSKVSQEQMRWELILSLEGDSGTKVLTRIDFGLWLDQNLRLDTFGPRDSDQFISFTSIFIFEALIWSAPYWQAWRPDGWPSLNGCRPRLWFPAWRSHIDQKSSPSCQGIQCLLNEQTHHIFLEAFVPFL